MTTASTAQISGSVSVIIRHETPSSELCHSWPVLGPECDPDRVERVAGHRLAQHRQVRVARRQPGVGCRSRSRRGRASARPRRGRRACSVPGRRALSGISQTGVRVARVGDEREPEVGRQAVGDLLPGLRPVVRAVDAAMVPLVQRVRLTRRHRELVDALPGHREAVLGVELRADADVARLPRDAAVARLEDADRGDADPGPVGVGRVGDDRVEDEPAGTRPPGRAGRMVGQALDVRPGRPAVGAAEQPGRLDAGEDGRRRASVARLQTVVDRPARRHRTSCPADEWVQVVPPSSLRQTAGPYHGLPAAARMAPLSRVRR